MQQTMRLFCCDASRDMRRAWRVNVNLEVPWRLLMPKSLELYLTEAELEALINAVRRTSEGRFADLEFKLRAAWRRALPLFDHP
jgi:hypothetical protein